VERADDDAFELAAERGDEVREQVVRERPGRLDISDKAVDGRRLDNPDEDRNVRVPPFSRSQMTWQSLVSVMMIFDNSIGIMLCT